MLEGGGCGLQAGCRALPVRTAVQTATPCPVSLLCSPRSWSLALLKGRLNLLRLLLARPTPTSAPLARESCRLLVGLTALPSRFPGYGNPSVWLSQAPSRRSYHRRYCLSHELSAAAFLEKKEKKVKKMQLRKRESKNSVLPHPNVSDSGTEADSCPYMSELCWEHTQSRGRFLSLTCFLLGHQKVEI